jgi:macrolide transport system ATP-binding/permease protein
MTAYLTIQHVAKSYSFHHILNDVSFVVNAGERIGLVGANGVGKSTLLKIVTGEIESDGGAVTLAPERRLGYLAQVIEGYDDQTLDALIAASVAAIHALEARLRALERQMPHADGGDLDRIMQEYGDASDQFERYGGYDLDYRIDTVLDGLGVAQIARDRVFGTLSGGEKARVGLALLLLQSPDVLLLDEPTNHLDFTTMAWLESYLQKYRGAILVVSHDRQFLNRIATAIVEIDEHSRAAKRYSGDYDSYQRAKAQERLKWARDYAAQQEEIKELRLAIRQTARQNQNYRAHTDNDKFVIYIKQQTHAETVSKRVKVAEEKLRRIEADPIPEPPDELRFEATFDPQALKGRVPLMVSHLGKRYGDKTVLDDVSFAVDLHSRIVLVGVNGAGKSTLMRILTGYEAPDSGQVYVNPAAKIGYLDQEGRTLDPALTVFEAYAQGLDGTEQALKSILLQSGLFRYDDIDKRVSMLSAGQARKLQIARLIAGGANLLVLDEPTNYVSFDVLEELETALTMFPGPVIAASHDRRFIEKLAQSGGQVWALEDGHLNVDGYAKYVGAQAHGQPASV